MRNLLKELEEFNHGHKARAVSLDIDDGYGATCWSLRLCNEKGKTITVSECSFFELPDPSGKLGDIPYYESKDPKDGIIIFVDRDLDNYWPGLERVVELGLRASKILLSE